LTDFVRMIAIGGTVGTLVAGSLAAPQFITAVASEPVEAVVSAVDELFGPEALDSRVFRKYDIAIDDSVSTEVQKTRTITKIAHGRKSTVTIVTTPTGTYSTDALLSPHVLYPGIEVGAKRRWDRRSFWMSRHSSGGSWSMYTSGSVTYFTYRSATRS